MVRCFILRGFWTWWSHDQSFPNWAEKCEILTKPQQFEKKMCQPLPLKQPYSVIWGEFQISLFRSGFSLKNKSMYKSNHLIWRMLPNLSWCSHHCFAHNRCSRLNKVILWPDSLSLLKMGIGTSWTIQIGRCHFSNCWGFVSISLLSAQLGKLWSWDHKVQNPLKMKHLTIPGSYQLGHIPHAPKSPPPYWFDS